MAPRRLEETGSPPRKYRPPSWEVDVSELGPGDPYPGQTEGREVRVDQDGNLRAEDGGLVPATEPSSRRSSHNPPSGPDHPCGAPYRSDRFRWFG